MKIIIDGTGIWYFVALFLPNGRKVKFDYENGKFYRIDIRPCTYDDYLDESKGMYFNIIFKSS